MGKNVEKLDPQYLRIVKVNFEKKPSEKSAWFKGFLELLIDNNDLIYDIKTTLLEVKFDLCSTDSWFETKNSNHRNLKEREKLFNLLKLGVQKKRIKGSKKYYFVNLDESKIKTLNDFINTDKTNTIKKTIWLVKGSNPSGAVSRPSSAEVLTDFRGTKIPFSILLEKMRIQGDSRMYNVSNYRGLVKEISFEEWVNGSEFISNTLNFFKSNKSKESEKERYKKILSIIKDRIEDNVMREVNVKKEIEKETKVYEDNIEEIKPQLKKLFNFNDKSYYDKAHIKSKKLIKDEIIQNNFNLKYINQISDIDNFLPLPNWVHKKFDSHKIVYNTNGELFFDVEKFDKDDVKKLYEECEKYNLLKLPKEFLTKGRVKYLENYWNNFDRTNMKKISVKSKNVNLTV